MKRLTGALLAAALLVTAFAGCQQAGQEPSGGDVATEPVTIIATDNSFDSQGIHNAIAKLVVENAFPGYTFTTSTASSTMNWQSMIAGTVDVDIESWTDNVATYPDDVANGDIIDVGILIPSAPQGFYVPRFVIEGDPDRGIEPLAPELRSVSDLAQYADVFPDAEDPTRSRIYGAIPGWMIDEVMYKKYEFYNLDEQYNYVRLGSEAALFASLVSAYNNGEGWVGYCYEPTWVAGKLDLVLLEDAPYDPDLYLEGQCEIPAQPLKIVCGKHFEEKVGPEVYSFFQKYQTSLELINGALNYLDENGATHEEAARWLLQENDELLDQWLPADKAELVRAAL